jgi:hypothetical protein
MMIDLLSKEIDHHGEFKVGRTQRCPFSATAEVAAT